MNWTLIMQSLGVAVGATAFAWLGGVITAIWILGLSRTTSLWVKGCALIVFALPPFLVTNCWLHLLGYTGTWHRWIPWSIYSVGGTIWILALMTWPATALLVSGAWARIEPCHLEYDPALRGLNLVRHLLWPMGQLACAQAAALTLVLTLNNFSVPALLQTKVYSAEVWVDFNSSFSLSKAMILSLPLMLGPCGLILILRRQGVSWPNLQPPASPRLLRERLGTPLFLGCGIISMGILAFALLLPLGDLLQSPATWRQTPVAFAAGRGAITHSFVIAASVATLCLVLGLLGSNLRRDWTPLLWLLFLVPGVILGIAFIQLFNRAWLTPFYQSLGIVLLAFVVRYLAIGWATARQAIGMTDTDLADTARAYGAGRWTIFKAAQWPQASGQLAAAWYVTYLLALWDVETLVLIVPPGAETVSLKIFNLLHYGHATQVNALCLILLGVAVTPLAAYGLGRLAFASRGARAGLLAAGMLCLSGCSPVPANQTSIQSKLFSAVEIIGTRGTGPGQFNKPRSLTVDRADNLYAVDMTGRVQKFTPDGVFISYWQMPQTDKGKPKGMALDQSGNIIVIEPHYSRANHFDQQGKLVSQWGRNGMKPGELFFPRSVTVNSHGEIYLSEYGMVERIQHFSAFGTNFLGSFGETGTAPGQLNRAEGIGIDDQDRVYVADSCNHRIQVFSGDGKFIRAHGTPGSGPGELSYPYDVRVDKAGLQFVCEFGNSRIQVFDSKDQLVETIGGVGFGPGAMNNPWSIALDSTGNLYVADSGNHRVQKFLRKRS